MQKPPPQTQESDSLLKRLAGPSTTKAGLAKDQTEINRIIAEASKGSKFYENEKKKDKDLTEKINRILRQRDEVIRGVDMHQVEAGVDQLVAKMEENRDLSQIIVHVDMDAFYANVELLDNPDLADKIFAVGHGVLTTASYKARKHGIRSGMPEYIAKKLCPELVVVSCNFSRYSEMSAVVMGIFRRYDPNMLAASVDEGYLNITQYCEDHMLTASECVQEMRDTVQRETRLTVSAGIAPNKLLAKICSDKNKPNGQFQLDFDAQAIKAFMHDLSIRKVPGVGRVNERLLESIGIKSCGDIYTHRGVLSLMDKQFGLHFLLQTYLGIASNVVQPGQRAERKSIGAERTFNALDSKEKILKKLEEVAAELESDMDHGGWTGKTVTLKYKLDTYQVFTRTKSFDRWISTKKEDLFSIGKELLLPELPLKLRLIGLRVTKLKDLRADAEKQAGGIKRFFESVDTRSSSPKKRRKLAADPDDEPSLSQDGFEETMPGFHEHEDLAHELLDEHTDLDPPTETISGDITGGSLTKPERPSMPLSSPVSSSVTHNPNTAHSHITTSKPLSFNDNHQSDKPVSTKGKEKAKDPPIDDERETQTCPICSKTMQMDNQGFNAHIDYCLSRGAIREAQAMASSSIRPKTKPESAQKKTTSETQWFKKVKR
ncbi:IMS-domain-containing protein [Cristinia sonorae]|uniref:DNA polymerase kappa n=1 Tax=Cristinia sonorae TaxID=1940300 RepID=A0A8K0UYH9_9AGAR|nr:IMS-domain-containing protein [Cristinia sonorae]